MRWSLRAPALNSQHPPFQFARPMNDDGRRRRCFRITKRMGKPATLLEGLCGHALSLGSQSIEVEYKDSRQWVFAFIGGAGFGIANYARSSDDAKELRGNLHAAAKKPVRAAFGGQVYILK